MPGATTTTTSCCRNWSRLSAFLAESRRHAKMLRRHRANPRTRSCGGGRNRLARQEHHADRSASSAPGFSSAEILTTLELAPDAPQPARCGTCTRCITACPTGAITEPHRLDARRCISYLTIELKGSIPLELRPLIGDRIYGCDDCLDACPWNRFAAVRARPLSPRGRRSAMPLRDYLALGRRRISRAFPRFADQADQAPRIPAKCLRRPGKCGRPRATCRRSNERATIRNH